MLTVMSTRGNKVPLRLTTFINEHHEEIIREWVAFARTLDLRTREMNERELRDHAEDLLTSLVSDMEIPESARERSAKSKGLAPTRRLGRVGQTHAAQRLGSGFKLADVVAEYRALRATVLRLWEGSDGEPQGDVTRFNEAIDEALSESTVRYASLVSEAREQVLAVLAHDLRTPLGAIVMGASLLSTSAQIDDKGVRVAARILDSANRMSRMISDLLDLARTRLGSGLPIKRTQSDLAVVSRQVIAELEAVHPDCPLRFESKGNLVGEWDSDRLTQVVSNLVSNALQYGCSAGPVHVETHQDGDDVVLSVKNEGPAIPDNVLATIFEPMVRHSISDQNASGLGLGLFIVREILTAHGGTIDVTSTAREGTTFTVRLPRSERGKGGKD